MNGPPRAPGEARTDAGRSWKVLIADDEPLARARLRALLARHPEFELTAECGNGAAVLAALRNGPADVLLLDIRMPGLDGIATVEALAALARPYGEIPDELLMQLREDFSLRGPLTEWQRQMRATIVKS